MIAFAATIPTAAAAFLVPLSSTDGLRDAYPTGIERQLATFGAGAQIGQRTLLQPSFHSVRDLAWTGPVPRLLGALIFGTIAAAQLALIAAVWRVTSGCWWLIPLAAFALVAYAAFQRLVRGERFTQRLLDAAPDEFHVGGRDGA